MYFWCIFGVFHVYITCISRVFPGYFRCITDVKSMYTSVFITCNIKLYMVANIYMICVRNSDALLTSYLAGWEQDSNRRTSASESDTLTDWATAAWLSNHHLHCAYQLHMSWKECTVLAYFYHTSETRWFMIFLLSGSKMLKKLQKHEIHDKREFYPSFTRFILV